MLSALLGLVRKISMNRNTWAVVLNNFVNSEKFLAAITVELFVAPVVFVFSVLDSEGFRLG